MEETKDRISYSGGCKINMGNYESKDVHMSYSTDVREEETPAEAMNRAKMLVEGLLAEEERVIRSGKVPLPTPENCGNFDDIKNEFEFRMETFGELHPDIATKAREYVEKNPTKETYIKAIETIKAYG